MTRDRFLDLSRLLCFRDDSNMQVLRDRFGYKGGEEGENYDENHFKLRKVWTVIFTVSTAILAFFVAGTWMALDESMIAFTGALAFIMYMPKKPIKVSLIVAFVVPGHFSQLTSLLLSSFRSTV
jgi:hypothetical protein